jgi:hypothetical protein
VVNLHRNFRYNLYFRLEAKNDLGLAFDYSRIITGVDLLLADATEKVTYIERVDKFLKAWMTGNNGELAGLR